MKQLNETAAPHGRVITSHGRPPCQMFSREFRLGKFAVRERAMGFDPEAVQAAHLLSRNGGSMLLEVE